MRTSYVEISCLSHAITLLIRNIILSLVMDLNRHAIPNRVLPRDFLSQIILDLPIAAINLIPERLLIKMLILGL